MLENFDLFTWQPFAFVEEPTLQGESCPCRVPGYAFKSHLHEPLDPEFCIFTEDLSQEEAPQG